MCNGQADRTKSQGCSCGGLGMTNARRDLEILTIRQGALLTLQYDIALSETHSDFVVLKLSCWSITHISVINTVLVMRLFTLIKQVLIFYLKCRWDPIWT